MMIPPGLVKSSMKVVVDVTSDDIANGSRKSIHSCPIALALGRAIKISPGQEFLGRNYVSVGASSLHFVTAGGRLFFGEHSEESEKFVKDFDETKEGTTPNLTGKKFVLNFREI